MFIIWCKVLIIRPRLEIHSISFTLFCSYSPLTQPAASEVMPRVKRRIGKNVSLDTNPSPLLKKKQPERILPTGIPSKWPWGWNQKWDLPVKCSLEILKTPTSSGYVCLHTSMLSCLSCIRLLATVWAVVGQAPLSMGFSREEYWSGLLCPPPGDLPDPGIEPVAPEAPALPADYLLLSHQGSPFKL